MYKNNYDIKYLTTIVYFFFLDAATFLALNQCVLSIVGAIWKCLSGKRQTKAREEFHSLLMQ